MPLPKPGKNEEKDTFISRCISFVKNDSPDIPNAQASAMCFTQWKDNKQDMKPISLSYNVPILVEALATIDSEDFIIQGIAINATTTDNNHRFLSEELRLAADSLTNKPLLKDHDNSTDSIIGRVIKTEFDELTESIKFKARINQTEQGKKIRELIKSGDLNTVSIGANVKSLDEENGLLIPRGISFKELSVVAVPADNYATFTFKGSNFLLALREAYNSQEKDYTCKECNKVFESKAELDKHMIDKHSEKTSQSSSFEDIKLIKKEEVMEKDEVVQSNNIVLEKIEALSKLVESVISENAEVKKFNSTVEEKLKVLSELSESVKALKEAEVKPTVVEVKETKVVEAKKEEVEEEDEEADIDLDEKSKYKIVQRHKSFTVERNYI